MRSLVVQLSCWVSGLCYEPSQFLSRNEAGMYVKHKTWKDVACRHLYVKIQMNAFLRRGRFSRNHWRLRKMSVFLFPSVCQYSLPFPPSFFFPLSSFSPLFLQLLFFYYGLLLSLPSFLVFLPFSPSLLFLLTPLPLGSQFKCKYSSQTQSTWLFPTLCSCLYFIYFSWG